MKRLIEIFIAILIFTVLISNVNAEESNPVTLTDDFKFEMNLSWSDPSDLRYHNYQRAIDYYNTNCPGQNYIIGSFMAGYGSNDVDLVCLGDDNLNISLSFVHYYQKDYYTLDILWQDSYDVHTFYTNNNTDGYLQQDHTAKGGEIVGRCCAVNGENRQSSINSTFKYNIETNANFVLYNSTGQFPSTPSAYYWNSYYPVTANETEYNINDPIFDSSGNLLAKDNSIDITGLDRVIFEFDIGYMRSNLNDDGFFKLQMNMSFTLLGEDKLQTFEQFDVPYISYESINANGKTRLFQDYNYTYSRLDYINTYDFVGNDYSIIQIEVPVRNLNSKYLQAIIETEVPYTVKKISVNEVEDESIYLTNYQFNNEYGVLLVPKLVVDNKAYSFYAKFIFNKNITIKKVWNYSENFYGENVSYSETITEDNTIKSIAFDSMESDYKNALVIINDYARNSSFQYDSRYFLIVKLDTIDSNPTFINPNTGEEDSFDASKVESYESIDSLFEQVNKFMVNTMTINSSIFSTIADFFNSLNPLIRSFIIAIVILFLAMVCFKILRR